MWLISGDPNILIDFHFQNSDVLLVNFLLQTPMSKSGVIRFHPIYFSRPRAVLFLCFFQHFLFLVP